MPPKCLAADVGKWVRLWPPIRDPGPTVLASRRVTSSAGGPLIRSAHAPIGRHQGAIKRLFPVFRACINP